MKDPNRNSPLHENAVHESAWKHVTGQALYVNDLPAPRGMLVAMIYPSPVAHGRIKKLDVSAAEAYPGIAAVITAKDIPGENDVSAIYNDEEMLASEEVNFMGQTVALIVGESYEICEQASKLIDLEIEPFEAIFDVREAIAKNSFHPGYHIIARGDLEEAWKNADFILEGEVESPGQEHWYLETHCAQAEINEDGDVVVYSSTQSPTGTQAAVAKVLGLPRSHVICILPRMGGGFGGKETQAAQFGALAGIGAWITRRPVRVWLNRDEDMTYSGKRHPFYSKYKAAFKNDGEMIGLQVYTYANAGWAHDLSRSILDRCLFHLDGAYFIPALHFEGHICKTNLQSNTAYRGFGGPQGFMVTETVLLRAARKLGISPMSIRQRNFYGPAPRNIMQYGAELKNFRIPRMVDEILASSKYLERKAAADEFNKTSRFIKRGVGFMPVKFGISFTATLLNQAGALVLVYSDGSVAINHGGSEMGQGLNTKMIVIASHDLGIPMDRIRLHNTRTDKVPNTSATAASSGTDLNGAAIHDACMQITKRLKTLVGKIFNVEDLDSIVFDNGHVLINGEQKMTMDDLIGRAYAERIQLAASGYYFTPDIGYDPEKGRGVPFAYYSYGVSVIEIECNTLTGEFKLVDVEAIHDVGDAIVPNIDRGQVEGAFVQGYGWLTCEELVWGPDGSLKTHSPATYKIPTIGTVPDPEHFRLRLLNNATAEAIHGSKAVGEPPFVLAVAIVEALEQVVIACGDDPKRDPEIHWPATSESVLRAIYKQQGKL